MCDDIKAGVPETELFDKYQGTYLTRYKGVQHAMSMFKKPKLCADPDEVKEPTVTTIWLFGDAGTGKSRRARKMAFQRGQSLYEKDKGTGIYWDNYIGEDAILLDEMDGATMKWSDFKRITDPFRGPLQVQIKGGTVYLKATTIYITSPQHPVDTYKTLRKVPNDWAQMKRRLYKIYHCSEYNPDIATGMIDVTDEPLPEPIIHDYQPKFNTE